MGMLQSYEDIVYPGVRDDRMWDECTACGGTGLIEWPVPMHDPDWDPCPNGCDPMSEPSWTQLTVIDDWDRLSKDALHADRVGLYDIRDQEIRRLQRAVETVKHGRAEWLHRTTMGPMPNESAVWVGDLEHGYWLYRAL